MPLTLNSDGGEDDNAEGTSGLDTHCVAALGGGRDLSSSSQQPPEMGFWYSHGAGEETGKESGLCLGSDLVLRPPSREMGRNRDHSHADRRCPGWTLSPSSFSFQNLP